MKTLVSTLFLFSILMMATTAMAEPQNTANKEVAPQKRCSPALDFTLRALNENRQINLCDEYHGKLVIIVNTASKCGFTPQFDGLEALYENYKDKGLVVLGFPSNDFGGQDPGTEEQIASFCRLTYDVKFPMFEKTHAKKKIASPIYHALAKLSGTYPKWNFYKYVISPRGEFLATYSSLTKPDSKRFISLIEKNLPAQ